MTRVTMLFSREYAPDVRVQKEAHTLALTGYQVTVLAWDRQQKHPVHQREEAPETLAAMVGQWQSHRIGPAQPITITRFQRVAGYGTGRRLLLQMIRFWWFLLQEMRRIRPDVIHANDLDTLPPALLYRAMTGAPVILDAREYYPGMVRATVGRWFSRVLEGLDRLLAPRADAILTVGQRLEARYCRMGAQRVSVVHNSQPLFDPALLEGQGRAWRQSIGVPDDARLVVYAGMLTPDRLIEPVLEAVTRLDRVWLAVAGDGPQAERVRQAAADCPRIHALGWIPLAQVPSLVWAADVVYYGLNAQDPNSFYFMPNLAFFALSIGRPLLVTPVGEIADVVRNAGCGWIMESTAPDAAERALSGMQDWDQRRATSARLGQTRYHWGAAAHTLLTVYESLKRFEVARASDGTVHTK